MSDKFRYRPEIDGLRAIAVLAVVFFHAGMGMPGGYAGVDVFFVISGFLITGLLIKELDQKRFTIVGFWERRIRRLFPALFVMVIATLVTGFIFGLPEPFENLAESAIAQAILLANVFFWRDSGGYFAMAAETQPLLHTWSLAVEEQFYLFFPLVMMLFWVRSTRLTKTLIWAVVVLSLGASIYLSGSRISLGAFYLLPTRAWELMLGAVIALHAKPRPSRRSVDETMAWGGLLAIIASFFVLSNTTPFPGWAALLPCLGTVAVIYGNRNRLTSAGRLLALRPIVFIGLISYSLYLWHWPVFVFGKTILFDFAVAVREPALIALSVLLGVLSWRFVETPFRKKQLAASRSRMFAFGIGGTVVVLLAAGTIKMGQGLPQRLPDEVLQLTEAEPNDTAGSQTLFYGGQMRKIGVQSDSPTFIFWGDSHALSMWPSIHNWAREAGVSGVFIARPSVTPIPGVWRPNSNLRDGRELNEQVRRFIQEHDIKQVVLCSRWAINVIGRPNGLMDSLITDKEVDELTPEIALGAFERGMRKNITSLNEAGVHVWIMRQVPRQTYDVPNALATAVVLNRDLSKIRGINLEQHHNRQAVVNEVLDRLVGPRVTILDPTPYMFDESGRSWIQIDGHASYSDDDHITTHGATRLRPLFEPVFEKMASQESPQ